MSGADAAAMLRDARRQAGLTQAQLATRAGVPQSVVSAYENGRRQPSLATLRRLVDATGGTLAVTTQRRVTPRAEQVRRHRDALLSTAAEFGATNLRMFGSVARGDAGPGSDVDLVADLPAATSLVRLAALRRRLSAILNMPVDIVPAGSLRPDVADAIERDAVAV
jgi:hypothetical protein